MAFSPAEETRIRELISEEYAAMNPYTSRHQGAHIDDGVDTSFVADGKATAAQALAATANNTANSANAAASAASAAAQAAQASASSANDAANASVKTVNNTPPDANGNVNTANTGGTGNHADLTNLGYAQSGHTGFSPAVHEHGAGDVTVAADVALSAWVTAVNADLSDLADDIDAIPAARDFTANPILEPELAANAVTDSKIGLRAATDEPANGNLVPINGKFITPWINGIRANMKYAFGEIETIKNLGSHVGTFDTRALVPSNTSGFSAITINDFVNVRVDETQDGATTRYIANAIAPSGAITWVFDIAFNVDISGMMPLATDAPDGNLAMFEDEKVVNSGIGTDDIMIKGVIRDYVQGVDFGGDGLPAIQTLVNESINDRHLDYETMSITMNATHSGHLTFRNIKGLSRLNINVNATINGNISALNCDCSVAVTTTVSNPLNSFVLSRNKGLCYLRADVPATIGGIQGTRDLILLDGDITTTAAVSMWADTRLYVRSGAFKPFSVLLDATNVLDIAPTADFIPGTIAGEGMIIAPGKPLETFARKGEGGDGDANIVVFDQQPTPQEIAALDDETLVLVHGVDVGGGTVIGGGGHERIDDFEAYEDSGHWAIRSSDHEFNSDNLYAVHMGIGNQGGQSEGVALFGVGTETTGVIQHSSGHAMHVDATIENGEIHFYGISSGQNGVTVDSIIRIGAYGGDAEGGGGNPKTITMHSTDETHGDSTYSFYRYNIPDLPPDGGIVDDIIISADNFKYIVTNVGSSLGATLLREVGEPIAPTLPQFHELERWTFWAASLTYVGWRRKDGGNLKEGANYTVSGTYYGQPFEITLVDGYGDLPNGEGVYVVNRGGRIHLEGGDENNYYGIEIFSAADPGAVAPPIPNTDVMATYWHGSRLKIELNNALYSMTGQERFELTMIEVMNSANIEMYSHIALTEKLFEPIDELFGMNPGEMFAMLEPAIRRIEDYCVQYGEFDMDDVHDWDVYNDVDELLNGLNMIDMIDPQLMSLKMDFIYITENGRELTVMPMGISGSKGSNEVIVPYIRNKESVQ